ncbi:MAG: bifunctional serine/threonine-protein kinase/formylglycine-generating enzyme family protein [Parachlamydiaceae bacterium]|nr:bifunctional serine/threonine-protein kinase/formylglycine-generating enzyme family protein [Parachlamydiaceae bacterium]
MEMRVLGDYNIIKPIGQGPLGAVFLAEHRFMKRQYALKVLPEELASDRGFIQRFEEEVSLLASLDHPNIVKIYNISFSNGQYFIVTDCIVDELGETTNLAQYVMGLGRPLEEDELFYILKKVADALDYAHSKKIGQRLMVHRCLKLNNILVGKKGQGIDIHLSDFGLSRIIGTGAVLTRTYKNVAEALNIGLNQISLKAGQDFYSNPPLDQQKLIPLHTSFLQNYAFFSPEQKRLDSPYLIDYKSDIYAFGVLVYFLLMNELPEGMFEMPSIRKRLKYNWDQLISQCLQHNPEKRPQSILEALNDICIDKKVPQQTYQPTIRTDEIKIEEVVKESLAKIDENQEMIPLSIEITKNEPVHVTEVSVGKETIESQEQKEEHVSIETVSLKPVLLKPQLDRPQTDMDPGAIFQINSSVKTYQPEPKEIANIKPLLTDMVIIEGGTFFQGSQDGNRDEMPKHSITLESYAIDIHPVTNEQFVRFLEVMGGEKDTHHNDIIRLRDSRIKRSGGKLNIESGYNKHPVVGVTWYGAVAYAKWVGKRLPTEAEWEIAARGGSENLFYPTGSEIEKNQANFFSSDTTAVMSYAANSYGLYDMAGNVYEWCHDWYGYNYYEISVQEPNNPQGPLQGVYRVLRGGCWKSLKEDLRCSRRHRNNPGTVNGTYGFRCAAGAQVS